MDLEEYEKLRPNCVVEYDGKRMLFNAPNRLTAWRAESLLIKEPDTVAWIAGFAAGDILLDIGANVGMYSILAATIRGVRVYAFEPESQNYALLNRNIHDNELNDRVFAFCAAISDTTRFHRLYLSQFVPGGSCHSFGEPVDFSERAVRSPFAQGCYSTTVDELVAQGAIPVPTHVKIDVDGIEPRVIAGARRTLEDRRLRSLLVETNTNLDSHWEMVDALLAAGFDYDPLEAQAGQKASGAFKGIGNYVFRR